MVQVPWPLTNNPGLKPQEGNGRLINVCPEGKADDTPVWRRAPGATVFARTPSVGSASIAFNANAVGESLFTGSTFFQLVGSTTNQWGIGTSSNTINYPTGTAQGDIVFLAGACDQDLTGWVTPTGFTALTVSSTGAPVGHSLYYKACTGDVSATMASPSTDNAVVCLAFTIRGAMTTAPICDTGTISTGASGDPDAANITLTTADGLAVAVGWLDDDVVSTVTPPTSFGGRIFANTTAGAGTNCAVMVAFQPRATTGSVTVSSFDTDGDDEWAAYSFTMRHD